MTLIPGLDSDQQPSEAQAEEAWAAGYRWWAGNVGGVGAADVWAPDTFSMLRAVGYRVLPIWVPGLAMTDSPTVDAAAARTAAKTIAGATGVIAYDTEELEHGEADLASFMRASCADHTAAGWLFVDYSGAGYDVGHRWLPSWVPEPPTSLPVGTAQQWAGNVTVAGVNVDRNLADAAFPLYPLTTPAPKPAPSPTPEDAVIHEDVTVTAAADGTGSYRADLPTGAVLTLAATLRTATLKGGETVAIIPVASGYGIDIAGFPPSSKVDVRVVFAQ